MSKIEIAWFVLAPGLIGGFLNALLVDGGLAMPFRETREDGTRWIHLGCLGNIALGGAAGILAFCFAPDTTDYKKSLGLCLLSGIAGGSFIASLLQKYSLMKSHQKTELNKENSAFLKGELEKVLKALTKKEKDRPRREVKKQQLPPTDAPSGEQQPPQPIDKTDQTKE